MSDKNEVEKQSFITEARRAQIVDAAITTLDEIGYANTSLAQIARRAGISTALISYHFRDKHDLMNQVLTMLVAESTAYILERTQAASTAREKLHVYIVSSLAYQGTHPRHNTALLEIIFHARTPEDVPYYKLQDDEEEAPLLELHQILRDGQASGEFREFNVFVMANVIRGAISEYITMPNSQVTNQIDLETYSSELVKIVDLVVMKPISTD